MKILYGPIISKLRVMAAVLLISMSAFAASLSDYRARVETARVATERLLDAVRSGESEEHAALVAEIENALPETERVGSSSVPIETDNRWLRQRLQAFAQTESDDEGELILVEISERLLAISEGAKRLEKAEAGDRSKDEDKRKLGEILGRKEFQKPGAKSESLFQKWWREFQEWLLKFFPENPDIGSSRTPGLASFQLLLQILIFILVIGIVGFLVYRFAPFVRRGLRRSKADGTGERIILGERIGETESAADLFSEAERLAREGNLRSAIRKGYIALLCELGDRKIVRLARHKTNRDYLRDLRERKGLLENVSVLTNSFEQSWYGARAATAGDWDDFRTSYRRTVNEAKERPK